MKKPIARALLIIVLAAILVWQVVLQWEISRHNQRIGDIARKVVTMDEQVAADHDRLPAR